MIGESSSMHHTSYLITILNVAVNVIIFIAFDDRFLLYANYL